jgi:hypothetical protein
MKIQELQSFKDPKKAALFDKYYPDLGVPLFEALGLAVWKKEDAVPS